MFCSATKLTLARKLHRCTSCGGVIEPGHEYCRWQSNIDGKWSTGKMHPECYDMHMEDSEGASFEYTLYQYERPIKDEV